MKSGIGQRIRKRREELNMSQDELARLMGYKSRSSINKIELEKTDVAGAKIDEFAKALRTTSSYLMGLETAYENIPNLIPLSGRNTRKIPLLGTIACGTPILAAENVEKEIVLPDDLAADF